MSEVAVTADPADEEAARIRQEYAQDAGDLKISVCARMIEGTRVVDIGCRYGHFPFYIKQTFPHMEVFGTDYYPENIELGRRCFPELGDDLILDSIYDTRLAAASFDTVTLMATIEHLEQAALAIKNINRILKPGGVFIVTTDSPYGVSFLRNHFRVEMRNMIRRIFGRAPHPLIPVIFNPDVPFARHIFEWRPQTLLTLCHVNGFRYESHDYVMRSNRRLERAVAKVLPFLGNEQILKVRKVSEAPREFV